MVGTIMQFLKSKRGAELRKIGPSGFSVGHELSKLLRATGI